METVYVVVARPVGGAWSLTGFLSDSAAAAADQAGYLATVFPSGYEYASQAFNS